MAKQKAGLAELEESIRTLEALVEELERGVKLTRRCQAALAEAEQRIEILLADDEEPVPFDADAQPQQ